MGFNPEDAKTWRELLGMIINDPYEKQRVLSATTINPITLTRWIRDTSTPRLDNLRPLLDALPQHRQRLAELIAKEFPQFFVEDTTWADTLEIPSNFYTRVLATYTTSTPLLRQDSICTLVIQQILDQLDPGPEELGIILALCVKPEPPRKVRSLCKMVGKARRYHGGDFESQIEFLGSESQTGSALMRGHPLIVQSQRDHRRLFPHHFRGPEQSVASFPILFADQTAGVLSLACTLPGFFTQKLQDLIQNYVNLLVLAFTAEDFYPLSSIDLGIMPTRSMQTHYTANIQQRVTHYMISRSNRSLTRPQAEAIVKQEVEAELLQLCC